MSGKKWPTAVRPTAWKEVEDAVQLGAQKLSLREQLDLVVQRAARLPQAFREARTPRIVPKDVEVIDAATGRILDRNATDFKARFAKLVERHGWEAVIEDFEDAARRFDAGERPAWWNATLERSHEAEQAARGKKVAPKGWLERPAADLASASRPQLRGLARRLGLTVAQLRALAGFAGPLKLALRLVGPLGRAWDLWQLYKFLHPTQVATEWKPHGLTKVRDWYHGPETHWWTSTGRGWTDVIASNVRTIGTVLPTSFFFDNIQTLRYTGDYIQGSAQYTSVADYHRTSNPAGFTAKRKLRRFPFPSPRPRVTRNPFRDTREQSDSGYDEPVPVFDHPRLRVVRVIRGPGTKPYPLRKVPWRPRSRPRDHERERKGEWIGFKKEWFITQLFGALTEIGDAVDAFYYALPDKYIYYNNRRTGEIYKNAQGEPYPIRRGLDAKIVQILDHYAEIDLNKAFVNLVLNEVQDTVIGRIGRGVANVNHALGLHHGLTFGPAL